MQDNTDTVLQQVAAERAKQDQKWGEQNHPQVSAEMVKCWSSGPLDLCSMYGLPSEKRAKQLTGARARSGDIDWATILIEEVSEYVHACQDLSPYDARKELLQIAAVAVAAIEAIDRGHYRGKK